MLVLGINESVWTASKKPNTHRAKAMTQKQVPLHRGGRPAPTFALAEHPPIAARLFSRPHAVSGQASRPSRAAPTPLAMGPARPGLRRSAASAGAKSRSPETRARHLVRRSSPEMSTPAIVNPTTSKENRTPGTSPSSVRKRRRRRADATPGS
jgi:hypothetical protein